MGGDVIGLVAVILTCGIPVAGMYTFYRVRKLTDRRTHCRTCSWRSNSHGAGTVSCRQISPLWHSPYQHRTGFLSDLCRYRSLYQ